MSGLTARGRRATSASLTALGVTVAALMAAGFIYLSVRASHSLTTAVVLGPVLLAVGIPLVSHLMRDEAETVRRIALVAVVLHISAAVVYVVFISGVYGVADFNLYDASGARVAQQLRQFDFAIPLGVGTRFTEVLTGVVYAIIGRSLLGGSMVFSWLSFWGLYFFWRALRVAVPDSNTVTYAALVFLMPSLVFWPATIGKDAWMVLMLGLSANGLARFLTHRWGGLLLLGLGLAGATAVRPHVAALVPVAAGTAVVVIPRGQPGPGTGRRGVLARMFLAGAVAVATGIVAGQVGTQFGVEDPLSTAGVEKVLEQTEQSTEIGGSAFETGPVTNPADTPVALVTVFFRPFPWEADSPQAVLTAMEGLFIAFLLWRWRTTLRALPRRLRQRPYLAFAAAFTLAFAFAFGNIGNFGILARQRTQMLPLLFALLASGTPETAEQP